MERLDATSGTVAEGLLNGVGRIEMTGKLVDNDPRV